MNANQVELVRRGAARPSQPSWEPLAAREPTSPLARARVHWQVWAPLLLRAVALAVALLGLAGIGSVAARAPVPRALGAPAGLELSSLSVQGLGGAAGVEALVSGAAAVEPSVPEPVARSAPASESASGAPAAGVPCPTHSGEKTRAERVEAVAEGAPVVLNRATPAELQRLPGVGAKRAAAIVALRQRLGRFRRANELLRVKGIGPRTLERLLPHVVLD